MSERQDFGDFQTDRPEHTSVLLTVGDVLAEPVVQAGAPEVIVGGRALSAEVRWVHVSDSPGVPRLLDGGELLLTTGAGWPTDATGLRDLADALHRAGVAGIFLELGAGQARIPDTLIEVCRGADLALIALTREVKFVAITEAVHRALIDAQTVALSERQRLHELFTALSLQGAPADVVVAETARALGAPVILENLTQEVIACEALRVPVAHALAQRHVAARVPVQARGVRWGTLLALPGPAHPAGRLTVLEQGATALAFGCIADRGDATWTLLAQRGIIEDLLGARFAHPADIAARLSAVGFALSGRHLHGVVVRGTGSTGELIRRARLAGADVVATRVGDDDLALLSLPGALTLTDVLAREVAGSAGTIFIGSASGDVLGLLASLRAARELAARDRSDAGSVVRRVDDRPLERFVASLRDDQRLLAHSERMLSPIAAYDRAHRGDLLEVLTALVTHPGNRSAAAAASHLSRSVFYQRLTLIGDLLDVDLDDGEILAALHLALLARRRAALTT